MNNPNIFIEEWNDYFHVSYKKTRHLYSEKTAFQNIDFFHNDFHGTFFTLDNVVMLTERDEFAYHEMIVHVAMATNPNIKTVLIIGGGDGGSAREILRYKNIEFVTLCEIDQRVFELSEKYLPKVCQGVRTDKRVNLIFADGVKYIKKISQGSYDLIIIDSTDPIPMSVGEELFNQEFYEICYQTLNEQGIMINQHQSPYFESDSQYFKAINLKLKTIFPIVEVYQYFMPCYPSGLWMFGFSSKKYHPINHHQPEIWQKNQLKTRYYNSQIHKGAFALPTYVREILN